MLSRLAIVCLLVLSGPLHGRIGVQDERPAAEGGEAPTQDGVERIRNSKKVFFEVRDEVIALWQSAPELHGEIRGLAAEEGLSAEVFVGLGRALAELGQRDEMPVYLEAVASGRHSEADRAKIVEFVIAEFHDRASILDALHAAMLRRLAEAEAFGRLVDLHGELFRRRRKEGAPPPEVERFGMMSRLAGFWADNAAAMPEAQTTRLRRALENLVESAADFPTAAGWQSWLEGFRKPEVEPPTLPLLDVYREAWQRARRDRDALREELRRQKERFIALRRAAGDPPADMLSDPDPIVRRTALVALQGMADKLEAEPRERALDSIVAMLEGEARIADPTALRDVLSAAGDLARRADPERQERIAGLVFAGEETNANPELLAAQIDALRKLGRLDRPDRLERVYDFANHPDRVDRPAWTTVRAEAVKAAVVGKNGVAFVLRALADARPEVRGVAATTLPRIRDRLAAGDTNPLVVLAERVDAEEDAITRRRMIEAYLEISRVHPDLLSDAALRPLLAAFRYRDPQTRTLVARAVRDALGGDRLTAELRAEGLEALRSALDDASSPELKEATIEVLSRELPRAARDLVADWLRREPQPPRSWTALATTLLAAYEDDPAAGWDLAAALGARKEPAWKDAAVDLGAALLARAEASPEHGLAPRVDELRAALAGWREEGGRPAGWREALKWLDGALEREPNDGRMLLRRARLGVRLAAAAADPTAARDLRERAEAEFLQALGEGTVGVEDEARAGAARSLSRLAFDGGKLGLALAEIERLEALGAAGDEDRLLAARAALVHRGAEKNSASDWLARLGEPFRQANAAEVALLSAAVAIGRPERLDVEAARAGLGLAGEAARGPLGEAIADRLSRIDELTTAKNDWLAGREPEAAEERLRNSGRLGIDVLLADFLARGAADESARRVYGLLRALVGADAPWSGAEWPAEGDVGASFAELRRVVGVWSRSRPLDEKLAALVLKRP